MALTSGICAMPGCGTEFTGRKTRKYCSDLCRDSHRNLQNGHTPREKKIKDPEMQRRGKANRAKGARAEREVCHIIKELTGDDVSRNLTQTRDAGGDVMWGPLYLEVKYQQNTSMFAWQAQATASAAAENMIPAVVYRRPQEEFWVSMPFDAFVRLFEALRVKAGLK